VDSVNDFIEVFPFIIIDANGIKIIICKMYPQENEYFLRHWLKSENTFNWVFRKQYVKVWAAFSCLMLTPTGGLR
jgi:hypothetical protein